MSKEVPAAGRPQPTPKTAQKARRLADSGSIKNVGGGVYQAASSGGDGSYFVTLSPPSCECVGFAIRKTCSHLLAAEILAGRGDDQP